MTHSIAAITRRDGREQGRFPATGSHERKTIPALPATGKVVALWYRMGLMAPHLRPPRRYRYAYDLGRRTAALKSPAHTAALLPGRAG